MKKLFYTLTLLLCLTSCAAADTPPAEAPTPLTVSTESHHLLASDQDGQRILAEFDYQTIILSAADAAQYPVLAEKLAQQNRESAAYAEEFLAWAEDFALQGAADEEYFYPYFSRQEHMVQRADSTVLSIRTDWSEFTGGAHSNYGTVCLNYDSATGRELVLTDVITDMTAFRKAVVDHLQQLDCPFPLDHVDETIALYGGEFDFIWSLSDQGIAVYFNPYDIAPFAAGRLIAEISFEQAPDLFHETYLPR